MSSMLNNRSTHIMKGLICITIVLLMTTYVKAFLWLDEIGFKHIIIICFNMIGLWIITLSMISKIEYIKNFNEVKQIFIAIIGLLIISVIFQLIKGELKLYTIKEVYFLITPLIFVFILHNVNKTNNIIIYINTYFYCAVFAFFYEHLGKISLENISKISLIHSSSPFEGDLANIFLPLLIFYVHKKKKNYAIICVCLNILSLKRANIVFMLVFLITVFLLNYDKKISKLFVNIIMVLFSIIPVLLYILFGSELFIIWFESSFDMSLYEFTMSRSMIINSVTKAGIDNFGLGGVTNFLELRNFQGQLNLHSDLLMIYMDCSLLGTLLFTKQYFEIVKSNIWSFTIMLFTFIELLVAHYIGSGTLSFWVLIYTLIFYFNNEFRNTENTKKLE